MAANRLDNSMTDRSRKRPERFLRSLARCQRGATALEYGLILALIVVVIIGAFSLVAERTNDMWNYVSKEVTSH